MMAPGSRSRMPLAGDGDEPARLEGGQGFADRLLAGTGHGRDLALGQPYRHVGRPAPGLGGLVVGQAQQEFQKPRRHVAGHDVFQLLAEVADAPAERMKNVGSVPCRDTRKILTEPWSR